MTKKLPLVVAALLAPLALYAILSGHAPVGQISLVTEEVSLGKVAPGIAPKTRTISPDSKHMAYAAKRGGKWFVVVDGQDGKEYDEDAQDGNAYDGFLQGSRLVWDSPDSLWDSLWHSSDSFHSVAARGNEFLRVETKIVKSNNGFRYVRGRVVRSARNPRLAARAARYRG